MWSPENGEWRMEYGVWRIGYTLGVCSVEMRPGAQGGGLLWEQTN